MWNMNYSPFAASQAITSHKTQELPIYGRGPIRGNFVDFSCFFKIDEGPAAVPGGKRGYEQERQGQIDSLTSLLFICLPTHQVFITPTRASPLSLLPLLLTVVFFIVHQFVLPVPISVRVHNNVTAPELGGAKFNAFGHAFHPRAYLF